MTATKTNRSFADYLRSVDACEEAVTWVGGRTAATAWTECERADWLLWILGINADEPGWITRQEVVRLACQCARRALVNVPVGEDGPRLAIEAAERWAGDPTEENRSAAWSAAYAAESAADAARSAADAAGSAAYAAWNAADAAEQKAMCDLIRATWKPTRKALASVR